MEPGYVDITCEGRSTPISNSGTRLLHTNNTNPVAAFYDGYVFDADSYQPISDVTISISNISVRTDAGGYYLGVVDPGLYDVELAAAGYDSQLIEDAIYPEGDVVRMDIGLLPALLGDIDGQYGVTLADAIIALKAMVGIDVSGQVRTDYDTSGADVDGDATVGMVEAIYILQEVAGVRTQ